MTLCLRLPFEILTAIVKELDNVQDIRHIRMTCHALCTVATPIAFRALSVIATKGSAQNLGRLLDLPDIVAYVREVSYHDTGTDRKGRVLNYIRSNAIQELARSFSRIHQLSHLEAINLTFYPINDNRVNSDKGGRLALQVSILGALVTSFRDRVPSKLTSLSLHNLRTSDLPSFESPPFQNLLKTLRRLQLSVLFDISPDDRTFPYRWSHFWGTLCPRVILAPTQHALTELTLHSDTYFGASSELSLAGLHFLHLHALSLRNLVFEPSIGAVPFILRHATSLVRLELLTCKLPTYTSILPLPWATPPPPADHGWNSIWDSFAAELTALVALHVDDPECSYVSAGLGLFFYLDSDRVSRDAADFAALERFHAVVDARSERCTMNTEDGVVAPDVLVGQR